MQNLKKIIQTYKKTINMLILNIYKMFLYTEYNPIIT